MLAARSEREARLLADARAEDIRNRLVRIAVASGIRLMEQGDTTGALPWFAEALMFDLRDPDAAETHRLRLGILLDQCPSLDGLFAHGRPINWAALDRPGAAGHGAAATGPPGSGTSPPAARSRPRCRTTARSTAPSSAATALGWSRPRTTASSASGTSTPAARRRPPLADGPRLARAVRPVQPGRPRVISAGPTGPSGPGIADGRPAGPTQQLGAAMIDLDVSPDGEVLAAVSATGLVRTWWRDGGRLQEVALLPKRPGVRKVALSPDGTRLATAGEDGRPGSGTPGRASRSRPRSCMAVG